MGGWGAGVACVIWVDVGAVCVMGAMSVCGGGS